jgi:hypothetical protein
MLCEISWRIVSPQMHLIRKRAMSGDPSLKDGARYGPVSRTTGRKLFEVRLLFQQFEKVNAARQGSWCTLRARCSSAHTRTSRFGTEGVSGLCSSVRSINRNSIGNYFLAAAQGFFRSLPSAIFLFASVTNSQVRALIIS